MAAHPELTTNEKWRGIMIRARKERGMTQEELGKKVGTSQNAISMLESGKVETSAFVIPICQVLKIPRPMHFDDEWQENWHDLGRLLREQDMESAETALKMVEALLRRTKPETTTDEPRRDKRK